MMKLPPLDKLEVSVHDALTNKIKKEITESGDSISFSSFMESVLYDHEYGYYMGNKKKFGEEGDFITAPMISDIFTKCFLNVFHKSFSNLPSIILELGAGNGQFAFDLLIAARQNNIQIDQYLIYEISENTIKKQKEIFRNKLTNELFSKIFWVDEIPENFDGIIFANEFLDAFPTNIYEIKNEKIYERKVNFKNNQFGWNIDDNDIPNFECPIDITNLPTGYIFEYSKKLDDWLKSLLNTVNKTQIFFVDYGFHQQELFHQDRIEGTLMCHYKHYAHANPFEFLGAQDITWHINFSQIANVAKNEKCTIGGFVSQANFLINAGALDLLAEYNPNNISEFKTQTNAFQKLISPAEMGDLVKVLSINKNADINTMGFNKNDRTFQL